MRDHAGCFSLEPERASEGNICVLRLESRDGTNRLTAACVLSLLKVLQSLTVAARPLVICGNERFFSAGADLSEIAALDGPSATQFSRMGQELMQAIASHPAPVCAAISGYCMGGGLDLALACHWRIAAHDSVFGHRGAALGLITGWGGTQRLLRLVGKTRALEAFITAEKIPASKALEIGLVQFLSDDPVKKAVQWICATRRV
jgi:enoyl-CoA hydratase